MGVCLEDQGDRVGCVVPPTHSFAAQDGLRPEELRASAGLRSTVQSFVQLEQPMAAWTAFPPQQQHESLPWHLREQITRHQDQGLVDQLTASNQGFGAVPSQRFVSNTAPPFQSNPDPSSQGLCSGAFSATVESNFAAAPIASVPCPSKQLSWQFCSGRKRPRAMIEAPHVPLTAAPTWLLGTQNVAQARLAIPLSHPSSPVIDASPSETFRLPSRSASPTPAQSQQTEEVECGGEEGGPCKRVCLPRPALAAPSQPLLLSGANLLTPPVQCKLCGHRRPIGLMNAHLKLECPVTPARCPHKGCSWQGPRQFLKLHVDKICKWVLVPCPFTAPGWPPMIPRGLVRDWQYPQPASAGVQPAAAKGPAGIASPCPVVPEAMPRRHVSINEDSEVDEGDAELQSDADSSWSRTKLPARPLLGRIPRMS